MSVHGALPARTFARACCHSSRGMPSGHSIRARSFDGSRLLWAGLWPRRRRKQRLRWRLSLAGGKLRELAPYPLPGPSLALLLRMPIASPQALLSLPQRLALVDRASLSRYIRANAATASAEVDRHAARPQCIASAIGCRWRRPARQRDRSRQHSQDPEQRQQGRRSDSTDYASECTSGDDPCDHSAVSRSRSIAARCSTICSVTDCP